MMRIGVICEGLTDFHAISSFLGDSLTRQKIQPVFVDIQPILDTTQSKGGWGNVLSWLQDNPPDYRIPRYLSDGLFADDLLSKPLDCLLIHLDSDILNDQAFRIYVNREYGYSIGKVSTPLQRAKEIRAVISHAARFGDMTKAVIKMHVLAPAVESTETWCVAAFVKRKQNFELLFGQKLINEFMSALEKSENQQLKSSYSKMNKSQRRRKRYCKKLASQSNYIINGCPQFQKIYQDLLRLVPS